jgi:hypothetical protein
MGLGPALLLLFTELFTGSSEFYLVEVKALQFGHELLVVDLAFSEVHRYLPDGIEVASVFAVFSLQSIQDVLKFLVLAHHIFPVPLELIEIPGEFLQVLHKVHLLHVLLLHSLHNNEGTFSISLIFYCRCEVGLSLGVFCVVLTTYSSLLRADNSSSKCSSGRCI